MVAWLLAVVLAIAAQDAPPDVAALQAEFEALQAEYASYSSSFWESLPTDADGTMHVTDEQMAKMPDKLFGERFLELGRRAGKTPAAAQALVKALRMVQQDADQRHAVTELLLASFLDAPELESAMPYFGGMRWSEGSAATEALLRRVIAGSPHAGVKAAATFQLAQVLMDPVYAVVGEGSPHATPRADTAPARALLVELGEKYADTPSAAQASGYLFELDHLQVGMTVPDVEATDQDGVRFKLSDYRGKVVLLDFWGFW